MPAEHLNAWICDQRTSKFQHLALTTPQYSPHQFTPPEYGSTAPQMDQQTEDSPYLTPADSNTVQQVVGKLLYYARLF